MKLISYISFAAVFFLYSCSDNSTSIENGGTNSGSDEWSVNPDEVVDGGPGIDGIPSLDSPNMRSVSDSEFSNLEDETEVVAVRYGDEISAYPVYILDWHEMVNDVVGGESICISYCPLTGTEVGWNRAVNGKVTTFGVSGLLYRNNLIPYDRSTRSYYSQMLMQGIHGEKKDEPLSIISTVRTTLGVLREHYSQARMLTERTGYARNYKSYPYGNYRTDHTYFIFPVKNEPIKSGDIQAKDRVIGYLKGEKAYYTALKDVDSIKIVRDDSVYIWMNTDLNTYTSFKTGENENLLSSDEPFPAVVQDSAGIHYDIFGYSTEDGSDKKLDMHPTMISYFFAWYDMYPKSTEK
jgi:hypothetical protein